ncbi:uncharacterized protein LOC122091890 isoform X2 [Macadamia integrifolia]|nr:uncharacterized protein LOC122091890 isoform X2 [Macadamia integrifolia]
MMNEMDLQESEEVKPFFVANFGKILFHWRPSSQLVSQKSALETALSQVKRSFYGNVPSSFVEYILHSVIPKIGVDFDEEQEYYHVQIFDKNRPRATLSCKCSAMKMEGKLELHRMQLNQVPQMVVDMSCPEKDLDLRLMLFTKKILKELPHDEINGIKNIIAEAIIDPDVKGGLRWPQGKETFGDRYTVEGTWHTKAKTFSNSSIMIQLRDANRYDFRASTGEVTKEVSLSMTGISMLLQDQMVEMGPIIELLEDTLKLIWEHFLRWSSEMTENFSPGETSWMPLQKCPRLDDPSEPRRGLPETGGSSFTVEENRERVQPSPVTPGAIPMPTGIAGDLSGYGEFQRRDQDPALGRLFSQAACNGASEESPKEFVILWVVHWYRQEVPPAPSMSGTENSRMCYMLKSFVDPYEGEKLRVVYINGCIPGFVFPPCYQEEARRLMDHFRRELASCVVESISVWSGFFIDLCRVLRSMRDRTYGTLSEREARGWIISLRDGGAMGVELPELRALVGRAWLLCMARDVAEKKIEIAPFLAKVDVQKNEAQRFQIVAEVIKSMALWHTEEAEHLLDEVHFVWFRGIPSHLTGLFSWCLEEWEATKHREIISDLFHEDGSCSVPGQSAAPSEAS